MDVLPPSWCAIGEEIPIESLVERYVLAVKQRTAILTARQTAVEDKVED